MAGNDSQSPYCEGSLYSNRISTDEMNPNSKNLAPYTPNCASMYVYNNSDVVVTFEGIPFSPGGSACYDEMIQGCYNQPINIKFAQGWTTGSFLVQKIIKVAR